MLEIPFHKYYNSYHLLVDQCHLNIFPIQYMFWGVLCFYVLKAYPGSYNSNHTNKIYVLEYLRLVKAFLMKVINVLFMFLKAYKAPLTLLTIKFSSNMDFM